MNKRLLAAAGCFLCELVAVGVGAGTNSLYTAPVCSDLGISRTGYSVSVTVIYLVNMLIYMLFPLLMKRVPLRGIFAVGLLCEMTAFLIYSQIRSAATLYLAAAFLGAGLALLGTVPITAVIKSWYPDRQGSVLGIVLSGSGIGGAALIPLAGILMNSHGWRAAALGSAGLMAIVATPCLLTVKENKQAGKHEGQKDGCVEPERFPFADRGLLTALLIYAFLTGASIQPTYLSIAAHLSEHGINTQNASAVLSVICFCALFVKVLLGAVSDRFGPYPAAACSHIGFILSAVTLVFFTGWLPIFEILFAFGSVPLALMLPLLSSHFFHKSPSRVLSLCMAFQTAGISLGILLTGKLYDMFSSYDPAFLLLGGVNFAAFILISVLFLIHQHKRSVPK